LLIISKPTGTDGYLNKIVVYVQSLICFALC